LDIVSKKSFQRASVMAPIPSFLRIASRHHLAAAHLLQFEVMERLAVVGVISSISCMPLRGLAGVDVPLRPRG
jgi:hypothetical protein